MCKVSFQSENDLFRIGLLSLVRMTAPTTNTEDNNDEEIQKQEKWLLERTSLTTKNDLACLTKLNLPNCGLSSLPPELPTLLPNLSILFMPKNHFEELPETVGSCQQLQMISFKDNGMKRIHPEALQCQLRWLILTGNSLEEIPETIGRCHKLQKLMLSGNSLTKLPSTVSKLENLELVRLACNQFGESPTQLLQLPNLRWVALSNNPFLYGLNSRGANDSDKHNNNILPIIDDSILEDDKWPVLGQGAGGVTRKATWANDDAGSPQVVAVKTYSGEITSDGSPQDERAINVVAASLNDDSLIKLFGQTSGNHSLVMEFLDGYEALAGPPSLESCSRDVYDPNQQNKLIGNETLCWSIVMNMLRVLCKLHQKGINHGDFYAHNILISTKTGTTSQSNETTTTTKDVKLSDFGAAFFYDSNTEYGKYIQTIELRSFIVLVEELYNKVVAAASTTTSKPWTRLKEACQEKDTTFESLVQQFQPTN